MSKTSTTSLHIDWQLQNKACIDPQRFHEWEISEDVLSYEEHLNKELGFPKYTLTYIKKAIDLSLKKDLPWKIQNDHPHKEALLKASQVYLRGIQNTLNSDQKDQGSYPIQIQEEPATRPFQDQNIFYVFDANFYHRWNKPLKLDSIKNKIVLGIDEENKTLFSVASVIAEWKQTKIPHWHIVGGGVVSDVAAFAAHLCKSSFTLYPTTLMAMVDACVGGKTGVNFLGLKNYVGSFYFPKEVFIYTSFLKTLPKNEFMSGISECLKHCLIGHDYNFTKKFLESNSAPKIEKDLLTELITIKARIVQKDANDQKERNHLNFGHNIAHAIESLFLKLRLPVLHGEAVWIGLLYDLVLCKNAGILEGSAFEEMLNLYMQADLKRPRAVLKQIIAQYPQKSFENLLPFLRKDKKNTGDFLTSVGLKNWSMPIFPVVFDELSHSKAWAEILQLLDI